LHFFVADYESQDRVSAGGGDAAKGEDIEVIELPLASALQMISAGAIRKPYRGKFNFFSSAA
jgi:hypothetical protein